MSVTLAQASTIVDVALKKGRETDCAPLDRGGARCRRAPGGVQARGSGPASCASTSRYGKAWGALGMGFGSRELAERAGKNPVFFGVLATVSQGRLDPGAGRRADQGRGGAVLGAVGISGDTSDKDEVCAVAGIEAAGLKAVVGA